MYSRRRLIVKGLKVEDIVCDLPKSNEEIYCSDCEKLLKFADQIIGGRPFCKECSPWYKEQEQLEKLVIDQDLLRGSGITPPRKVIEEIEAELDFGERDYWD